MKTPKIIYLLIFVPFAFLSCEKMEDFNLSQTIFIEDPYYPGLPVYSEWGYNTFGAYIDRKPLVSTNYDLPVKIIVNDDIVRMNMRGQMGSTDVDLKFSFKGYSPTTHYELTALNETTINLKDEGSEVILNMLDRKRKLDIIEGELKFNRVQLLYVDEELTRTIVSGYFYLKTFLDGEPIAISYGRFDFGIGYENFYNY